MKRLLFCLVFCFLPMALGATPQGKTLTILYTGDTYGVLGYPGFPGGLARRKQAIHRIRRENPNLLILDSGNALSPFYFSRLDRAQLMFTALDEMGYDALNLGSHEFDYGQEWLASLQKKAKALRLLSSNIRQKSSDSPWVQEFIIKEIAGIRVGIIGLCDPRVEQETIVGNFAGLEAQDPGSTLKRLLPKIRPKVKLLVLLSNIPAERLLKLVERTQGIDIVISRSTGGETEYDHDPSPNAYDFRYFIAASSSTTSKPRLRTLFAHASRFGYELGRVDTTFRSGELTEIEPSVVDLPVGGLEDPELKSMVEDRIQSMEQTYGAVFVDRLKERLGRPWDKEDFLHLVLVIMKRFSRAEIAVINETAFFKLEFINNYISKVNQLSLIDFHHLPWTDNHLVQQKMTGAQLKKLVEENNDTPRLRLLGLKVNADSSILVNGRPIKDDEMYTVATSNYLASGIHPWPTLRQGHDLGETFGNKRIVLRDLFIETLEKEARVPLSLEEWSEHYQREKTNPYPTQWRISLERLSLNLSNLETHNQGAFTAVRDARVRASDQFTIGTSGHLGIMLDHALFGWKNEAKAAFSRVSLPNNVVNNPIDSFIFGSQINGRALKIPLGFGRHALPSLRVSYDTEFSPTPGNPRRKLLRFQPGLFTTLGGFFEEIRLGGVTELDFSTTDTDTEYGFSFYSKLRKPWGQALTFSQEIEFLYFTPSDKDTLDDLLWQGNFRHRIDVPLWKDLSLSPYLDIFTWRGKLIPETGWNLLVGVSLSYGKLWKL